METLIAAGGFRIVADAHRSPRKFGVFVDNRAIDWFSRYEDASKLAQDLFVTRARIDDPMIGTIKFCPSALGNGQNVVVVAKTKNGYVVQPCGGPSANRMEVSGEVLSEPISYPF